MKAREAEASSALAVETGRVKGCEWAVMWLRLIILSYFITESTAFFSPALFRFLTEN
jgi:hypothetical protein